MREFRSLGSVRGAAREGRPYRDPSAGVYPESRAPRRPTTLGARPLDYAPEYSSPFRARGPAPSRDGSNSPPSRDEPPNLECAYVPRGRETPPADLALSEDARLVLADAIADSLALPPEELTEEWKEEVARRIEAVERGESTLIEPEEVRAKLRATLRSPGEGPGVSGE